VVFGGEAGGELGFGRSENLQPARIDGIDIRFFFKEMQRGLALRTGFGDGHRAVVEHPTGQRLALVVPVETPGDHQMHHHPLAVRKTEGDSLPDAPDTDQRLAFERPDRRLDGPEEEGGGEFDLF
jgi:hypothetical protein